MKSHPFKNAIDAPASVPGEDGRVDDPTPVISRLLGRPIDSIDRISRGRNSRVYRVTDRTGAQYAAKLYFRDSGGGRDRLATEFSSLTFLWENGERAIVEPVAADSELGCAIYGFVDGDPMISSGVSHQDVDQAVAFLARLRELANRDIGDSLPPAAEACFSIQEIVESIEFRLKRLWEIQGAGRQTDELHSFLSGEFAPALEKAKLFLGECGISSSSVLDRQQRTLSPSDFGFHNALKRPNGNVVFLDFEYFGWDDPAKMISDFLLHPAMELGELLRQRFLKGILNVFDDYPSLTERVQTVYPFFGLKWCLILLNEFVPEHLERRDFAGMEPASSEESQTRQLAKAVSMLGGLNVSYVNLT